MTDDELESWYASLGPCEIWTGRIENTGYGKTNKRVWAHRAAWAAVHGPIPPGLQVMHLCDNPPCVRVSHLRTGTRAENMADAAAKGRFKNHRGQRDKTHCINGHIFSPANTRVSTDGRHRRCRACHRARAAGRDPKLEPTR